MLLDRAKDAEHPQATPLCALYKLWDAEDVVPLDGTIGMHASNAFNKGLERFRGR